MAPVPGRRRRRLHLCGGRLLLLIGGLVISGRAGGGAGEPGVDRHRGVRAGGVERWIVGVAGRPQGEGVVADRGDLAESRSGNHHRYRAGGRREVDVLGQLAERRELGDDVGGHETRPFERLNESVSSVDQLVDLLAGEVAAARQLAEHSLAVGASLLDHLPALLLGHLQLGLGVLLGVAAPAGSLAVGLVAEVLGILACLAHHSFGGFLRLGPDRRGALARRLEDARRLLAEQAGQRLVVELGWRPRTLQTHRPQLLVEIAFALLHAGQFGSDHAQELTHLVLVESATRRREVGVAHRRRRRRVGARERDGHIPSVDGMFTEFGVIPPSGSGSPPRRSRAASASSMFADDDQLDVVAGHLPGAGHVVVGLSGGHDEVLDPGLTDGRDLLGKSADRPDRAVELHRAGDGDVEPTEQVALGELVEQRQRERQAGARPADLAGVEGDLERQVARTGCRRGRTR